MATIVVESGGTYTTVAAAYGSLSADPTEEQIIEIRGDYNGQASGGITLALSNANAVDLVIQGQDGYRPTDHASWPDMAAGEGSGARMESADANPLILVTGTGWIVRYLRIGSWRAGIKPRNTFTIHDCVMWGDPAQGFASGIEPDNASSDVIAWNLAIYQMGSSRGAVRLTNGTANFYHCSTQGPGIGFQQVTAGTLNCYGCVVDNSVCFNGTIGGDENVSTDATAPGTTAWINQTSVFASTTAGAEDLHLNSGKSESYPVTDRTGTIAALAFDIDGAARAYFDAGCDEISPAPGGSGSTWYYRALQSAVTA